MVLVPISGLGHIPCSIEAQKDLLKRSTKRSPPEVHKRSVLPYLRASGSGRKRTLDRHRVEDLNGGGGWEWIRTGTGGKGVAAGDGRCVLSIV